MINLVLITSVICTTNNPLSYSNVRSVFNHYDRYQQTINTITSIRQNIPNCKILLVECSNIPMEYESTLSNLVDYYINIYSNIDDRNKINSCSKSLGEGTMTIRAIEYLIDNNIKFDNFIKITGRYWLSNNFNYDTFNNSKNVVHYIHGNPDNISTSLYKLNSNVVNNFLDFLYNTQELMYKCIGYEVLFAGFVNIIDNVINVDKIGVNGYVSVCGSLIDD